MYTFAIVNAAGPILIALSVSCVALGANAPESLAGKMFRLDGGIPSLRTFSTSTYELGAGGHFKTVMSASTSTVDLRYNTTFRIFITSAGADGDYSYTRIDDSTGMLTMQSSGGGTNEWQLTFESPSAGTAGTGFGFRLSDVSDFQAAPALSISTRGHVSPGHPMIVGFVVPGRAPTLADPLGTNKRELLIRAVGPSLEPLGVTNVWADPDFEVVKLGESPAGVRPSYYGDWTTIQWGSSIDANPGGVEAFRKIFDYVGAFDLLDDSRDAVDFIRLNPGGYTVVASVGPNDPGGEALIEVYFLP